jgi:hypothetical protein
MATPKEQHDARPRAITGTSFEQRRERDRARRAGIDAEHGDPPVDPAHAHGDEGDRNAGPTPPSIH